MEHWKPIEQNIDDSIHNTPTRSLLTPINEAFDSVVGLTTPFAAYSSSGYGSRLLRRPLTETTQRLTNFWHSSYSTTSGRVLFEGFRSGTPVHYGEPNESTRRHATVQNVEELLDATALLQISKARTTSLELHLTTLDLQTNWNDADPAPLESLTVKESHAALLYFNNYTKHYRVGDSTVSVTFRIHAMNFPTELKLFNGVDGWSIHSSCVDEARHLLTRAKTDTTSSNRTKIASLVAEIEPVLTAEQYLIPTNIYGLSARLLNLAYLIGDTVHFNCRSGKDRTGMLDVETKFVAHQLELQEQGHRTSRLTEFPLHSERQIWRQLLLRTGNIEIQELNTGMRGSMLRQLTECRNTDPFVQRIGEDNWDEFIGESEEVSNRVVYRVSGNHSEMNVETTVDNR